MPGLYLLAVLPPKQLSEEINEIRIECSEKFGVKKALKPPVHITLYRPFHMEISFEKQMIRLLHQATSHLQPYDQQLENFGSFNLDVIYIHALKNQVITDLHQAIVSVFRKHPVDPQKKSSAFSPHITIAYRDVLPQVFPLIWNEYKDRKFKRKFWADHFTLLRHDGVQWNRVEDFKLMGPEQPSLFG
jgi:2'-5' RNA ligase